MSIIHIEQRLGLFALHSFNLRSTLVIFICEKRYLRVFNFFLFDRLIRYCTNNII